jgi:protein N-terminal methyltransferase
MASSTSTTPPLVQEPVIRDSLTYWENQSATYDGVLGVCPDISHHLPTSHLARWLWLWRTLFFYLLVFVKPDVLVQSLPRVESLGSRKFLLYLFPELATVPSAARPLKPPPSRRFRALDVGAGIGRVTSDTLLPLVSDVVLLEPVESLIQTALSQGRASAVAKLSPNESKLPLQKRKWKGIEDGSKSVTFLQGTLQACDPAKPIQTATFLGRVGYTPPLPDDNTGFDVVWCQWCLGYMKDADLFAFLKQSQAALRKESPGVIVVKDNVCKDEGGNPTVVFHEEDSSLTRYVLLSASLLEVSKTLPRSDLEWKRVFREAGLRLIHEKVQHGLPKHLFVVKM